MSLYDACPRCRHPHMEAWACPYCGYVNWRAVGTAGAASLTLIALAVWMRLPFLPPDLVMILRVVAGVFGSVVLVFWVGAALYTAFHPRTQRARQVLASAAERDVEGLVRGLADADGWVRYVAYNEAESVTADQFWAVPHSLRAQATASMLSDLQEQESYPHRELAAVTLGKLGDVQAVQPLIDLLSDPDEGARQSAMWALGWLGSRITDAERRQQIGTALVNVLEGPPLIGQHQAAWALGRMNDPRAVDTLTDIIRCRAGDSEPLVALYAARGLGLIGTPALPAVERLLKEEDPSVRLTGVWALEELLSAQDNVHLRWAAARLVDAARLDDDERVRHAANKAGEML